MKSCPTDDGRLVDPGELRGVNGASRRSVFPFPRGGAVRSQEPVRGTPPYRMMLVRPSCRLGTPAFGPRKTDAGSSRAAKPTDRLGRVSGASVQPDGRAHDTGAPIS